jgi:hypothetical protein
LGVVENMSGLVQRVPDMRFAYAPAAVVRDAAAAIAEGAATGDGALKKDGPAAEAVSSSQEGSTAEPMLDVTQHVLALLRTQFQDLQNLVRRN